MCHGHNVFVELPRSGRQVRWHRDYGKLEPETLFSPAWHRSVLWYPVCWVAWQP